MVRKICFLLYISFSFLFTAKAQNIYTLNKEKSWVKDFPVQSVAMPQGIGQVIKVIKNPNNVFEIYLATAQSVWYSDNNGASYTPILSDEIPPQIATIDVEWQSKTIWVATQKGVFYSQDHGKKWISAGLSHVKNITHFIFISDQEICVSAMGEPHSEKGIFKTYDKGKNWKQTFGQVGVINLKNTPSAPSTLFLSAWDMKRTPSELIVSGQKSGIYKSSDAGENWQLMTTSDSGFLRNNVGKISLALHGRNVYALVDNRNKSEENWTDLSIEHISEEAFLNLENDKLRHYLAEKGLHEKYSPETLKNIIRHKTATPSTLSEYIEAPWSVIGAELYYSSDGGISWEKRNAPSLHHIFYGKGYEVGYLAINPKNENELFLSGVPLLHSTDGGKHWNLLKNNHITTKVHQLSVHEKQLIYVTNEGFFESFDMGKTWTKPSIAQSISVNSMAIGNAKEKSLWISINQQGIWKNSQGKWLQISKENGTLVVDSHGKYYLTQPLGNIFVDDLTQEILPHNPKDGKQRFGKNTPLLISPHNNSILYTGSNYLLQSFNEGKQWNTISNDLTNGDKGGNLAHATLCAIAESPFQFGLLYTGSDDGIIYTSKNAGVSWQMVYSSFPQPNSVACLTASAYKKTRIYAILKSSNQQTLLFKSENSGKTWDNLKSNLPEENANVIIEDDKNEQLLYLGTENGLYVSFDQGEQWHIFSKIPRISVNQLVINPVEQVLYIGTQGRGIFKIDITPLKELRAAIQDQLFYPLKDSYRIKHSNKWGNSSNAWELPQTPTMVFDAFASKSGNKIVVKIQKDDMILNTFTHQTTEGFNFIAYHLNFNLEGKTAYEKQEQITIHRQNDGNYYLPQGNYQVHFEGDLIDETRTFYIE